MKRFTCKWIWNPLKKKSLIFNGIITDYNSEDMFFNYQD